MMLRNKKIGSLFKRNIKIFTASLTVDNQNGTPRQDENPIRRTFNILRKDMKKVKDFVLSSDKDTEKDVAAATRMSIKTRSAPGEFVTHCDVLVIGGGGVGSSVAYWLKKKARDGLNVVVVERDPTYSCTSTVLSVGGLRQQYSLPENIQMSLFGADFLRDIKGNLGDVNLNYTPHGYLILASENSSEELKRNSNLQNELGARNELLSVERLKAKFPWLNTHGIELGCHGLEKEGWFDPWALLMGFKHKAIEYGAHYITGDVTGFEFKNQPDIVIEGDANHDNGSYDAIDKAVVKLPSGEVKTVKFSICVLAAGANSGEIARLAKIGTGPGILRIPLPVEQRKRYVYVFNTQAMNAPGLNTPFTIDPDGTYFRRVGLGGNYLCGRSPCNSPEPPTKNLDVDYEYFETDIWPTLAKRVPAFKSATVKSSWAGFFEYNVFDETGVIGAHPYYSNLFIATGFSSYGIQQIPALGRAVSELIIDSQFRTIDLTRLGFDRILVDRPMFETHFV